jgi:hypothetical protein
MGHFLATVTAGFLFSLSVLVLPTSTAERERQQLPCTHPLRIARPQLFAHCESAACTYTSWSPWRKIPNSVITVPAGKCATGEAYSEERTRTAVGNGCSESLHETQQICKY